ncbi:MAG: hypothetical protein EOP49_18600 [Sphingobacteriales bacterium]|nr:MAG: hypothetical protein EOP49_18600 [Sphingobacteriales bacterium]
MKPKLWQLLPGFIIFYYLIHLIQDVPNLVNGNHRFEYLPGTGIAMLNRIVQMVLLAGFAIGAYLALLQWYPKNILLAVVLITLSSGLLFVSGYLADQSAIRLRHYFVNNVYYAIIYTVFGIVFFFVQYSHYKETQARELLLSQRQSELAFLRSQINPHFLFNSLNNIYALVYEGSPRSLEAIAGFSELMRYMLYDTTDRIGLTTEIEYLRKYIALQQLRFADTMEIRIAISGEEHPRELAPLLLIPFIENAFKHGRFSEPGDQLTITINNNPDALYFYCHNRISHAQKDVQGGVGLTNVRKRLALLYPSHHELVVINDNENFTVKLQLQNT